VGEPSSLVNSKRKDDLASQAGPGRTWNILGPRPERIPSSQGGAGAAPKPFPINWRLERAYCFSATKHRARFLALCKARGVQWRTKTGWRGCSLEPTAGKRNPAKNLAANK